MKASYVVIAIVIVAAVILGFLTLNPMILVEEPYSVMGHGSAAIYLRIRNIGLRELCIVGVEVIEPPNLVAMLHATVVEDGVAKMKPVERVCAAPLGTIELRRGGYHVMIGGELGETKSFKIRLILSDGHILVVNAPVRGSIG